MKVDPDLYIHLKEHIRDIRLKGCKDHEQIVKVPLKLICNFICKKKFESQMVGNLTLNRMDGSTG